MNSLFSLKERISRSVWWIGMIIMLVSCKLLSVLFVSFMTRGIVLSEKNFTTYLLVNFIFFAPLIFIGTFYTIKRFHDRDKGIEWVLIFFLLPLVIFFLTQIVFHFLLLIFVIGPVSLVLFGWVIIECGFLKGTDGPNRFGEDPLVTTFVGINEQQLSSEVTL